jgi:hypothetical protein
MEYRRLAESEWIEKPLEHVCPECHGEDPDCSLCGGSGTISNDAYRIWKREQHSIDKAKRMGVD